MTTNSHADRSLFDPTNGDQIRQFAQLNLDGQHLSIVPYPETLSRWKRMGSEVLEILSSRGMSPLEGFFFCQQLAQFLEETIDLPGRVTVKRTHQKGLIHVDPAQ